jgi:hypothetical protein
MGRWPRSLSGPSDRKRALFSCLRPRQGRIQPGSFIPRVLPRLRHPLKEGDNPGLRLCDPSRVAYPENSVAPLVKAIATTCSNEVKQSKSRKKLGEYFNALKADKVTNGKVAVKPYWPIGFVANCTLRMAKPSSKPRGE